MNKYKKIAMAVVSTVMAGAMLVPLAACKPKGINKPTGSNQAELTPMLDDDGKLNWGNDVSLNVSVGHNSDDVGAAYSSNNITKLNTYFGVSSGAPLYGGEYAKDNFKPAWKELAEYLGVTFVNKYTGKKSEAQMSSIKETQEGLAGVDLFTSSASDLNKEATTDGEAILDITKYLKYMPNYSAFLDANPTTRLSLTAGSDGSMYMLPYFDGNDDIEKYVLLRKDIVEDLLNVSSDVTGAISYNKNLTDKKDYGTGTATASYVESFMGKTGSWKIAVTDPSALDATADADKDWGNNAYKTKEGQAAKTIEITVSYDDALANAKSNEAGSMGAILAAANVSATDISAQTSGNIIDIMNLAINKTEGAVTGDTLTKLLRKYIEVAYKYNNASFYTTDGRKLADVFNSAYAAWDVDLYVALGRCFTTSGTFLGDKVKSSENLFLLTGRQSRTDRFNDTVALAGELYGVRGMGNLYQYTYFDSKGNLLDARTGTAMFEALDNMNKLTKEGLFAPLITKTSITGNEASHSGTENSGIQTLSLRDYVQTQTANEGFRAESEADNDYNFAPVLTPVSNWDTNSDGKADKIMRFTESWRTVKTTGFGISYKAMAADTTGAKLSATLALVDYMFSNDGQILMTYGPMSQNSNDNGTVDAAKTKDNGFWYATEVTDVNIATVAEKYEGSEQYHVKEAYKDKYFVYKNKVYTGTFYNGRQIPTMTASNLAMFHNLGNNSFTNYARYYIGTTLPIGNKDQGFEYQCTSKCGLRGSDIVALALVNGTIEHVVQQIPGLSGNKLGNWYSVVPTVLFYDSDVQNMLTAGTDTVKYYLVTGFNSDMGHLFVNGSGSVGNFAHDIMANGLGSDRAISLLASADASAKIPADAAACVTYLNTYGMDVFAEEMNASWKTLQKVYVK